MPVPTLITELSTTAVSNYPSGSDSPATLDDVQRAHGAFIAQIRDGVVAVAGTGLTGTASALSIGGNAATATLATNATNATNVTGTIASGVTATTQTAGDNSTKVATTAYVKTATDASGVQIQPISASIAANAITVTPSALSLDFRNTTLTTGTVTRVSGTPAALVIAATDSFGLVTAAGNQRIAILAINNAGTIELAASALVGGVSLDETGVITTATAATLGAHIKAANVRTGVAYRVVGFVDATFTTATGWGSLALVQGTGGNAATSLGSLGYGQTWQDVVGSRAYSTTYYNTTGKPIMVCTSCSGSTGSSNSTVIVNGVVAATMAISSSISLGVSHTVIVPPGSSYSATSNSGLATWVELR